VKLIVTVVETFAEPTLKLKISFVEGIFLNFRISFKIPIPVNILFQKPKEGKNKWCKMYCSDFLTRAVQYISKERIIHGCHIVSFAYAFKLLNFA
jgi:hypothetical protein